ncbi:MAG: MFS transporter [Acidimicrobiales bacterium]|nr:MFS transporter [Acidimicrobiales bacterium]
MSGRFTSLEIPLYRRLLIGGIFNFLAMQIALIARAWLAYDLTGSNTALGGVLIGFGISSIVAIPSAGVLADRFSKRSILLLTGTGQGLVSAALALAVATDSIEYWMLVMASVVQGAMISFIAPARMGFMADAVDRERLTNAVFLSQSSVQLTRVFGPAAAGALIGVDAIGVAGVYVIAALCSAAGIAYTVGLPAGRPTATSNQTPLGDLVDGLRYVRSNRPVAHLITLSFIVVLVAFPHTAFLPVVADDVFDTGSFGFGMLTTAAAVGALGTSLGLANIDRSRLWRLQALAAVAFGGFLLAFGMAPSFAVAVALIFCVGAASAAFQAMNNSLVLTSVPVEYHGRMQSLLMLSFSGFGLAALPLGIVADALGLRETLVIMGAVVVAVSTWSLVRRGDGPDATDIASGPVSSDAATDPAGEVRR